MRKYSGENLYFTIKKLNKRHEMDITMPLGEEDNVILSKILSKTVLAKIIESNIHSQTTIINNINIKK